MYVCLSLSFVSYAFPLKHLLIHSLTYPLIFRHIIPLVLPLPLILPLVLPVTPPLILPLILRLVPSVLNRDFKNVMLSSTSSDDKISELRSRIDSQEAVVRGDIKQLKVRSCEETGDNRETIKRKYSKRYDKFCAYFETNMVDLNLLLLLSQTLFQLPY